MLVSIISILYIGACFYTISRLQKSKSSLIEDGLSAPLFAGIQWSLIGYIIPVLLRLRPRALPYLETFLLSPYRPYLLLVVYIVGMWIGIRIRKIVPAHDDGLVKTNAYVRNAIILGAVGLTIELISVLLGVF